MRLLCLSCLFVFFVVHMPAALRADDAPQRAKDALVVRALLRLPGVDLNEKSEAKTALLRHLDTIRGSEQYVDIVEKFKLREMAKGSGASVARAAQESLRRLGQEVRPKE